MSKATPGSPETAPARHAGKRPSLRDLAGMAEARQWGEALAQDLQDFRAGRIGWNQVDPACLLHGPPGTGKTTFAGALARTCGIPLVTTSFGEWQSSGEGHLGNLLAAMSEVFVRAKTRAPCIFFIDELDAVPVRANTGPHSNYWNSVVNHLLKLFDDARGMPGLVIVGACNHAAMLDPALLRAGRLDRQIAIGLPGVDDLPQILRHHLAEDANALGDLKSVALLCVGMSGAEIERLVRSVRRVARRARRLVRYEDMIAALEAGSTVMDPEERRRIAVHEAGHAIVAYRLRLSDNITVTLIPGGSFAGRVSIIPRHQALTRPMVEDRLVMLLAGRAAELALLDGPSAGAGGDKESDLARATTLALAAVGSLGLSTRESLLWHGPADGDVLDLNRYPAAIVDEVRQMIDDANERALMFMRSESRFVDTLASLLIERRAVTRNDIAELQRKLDGADKKRSPSTSSRDGFENFELALQELDEPAPRKLAAMDWILEELARRPCETLKHPRPVPAKSEELGARRSRTAESLRSGEIEK